MTITVKILDKDGLEKFLEDLQNEYILMAPVCRKQGRKKKIVYEELQDVSALCLGKRPDSPLKELFLPQNENLGKEGKGESAQGLEKKRVIFGVRPCDLAALEILDDVFLNEDPPDDYYQERRENTLILGYACFQRDENCFCEALGIDPVDNEGVGIMIYADGEDYWVEARNEEYKKLVEELPQGDKKELEKMIIEKRAAMEPGKFTLEVPLPLPESSVFDAPFWEDVTSKCLSCGICTFYCPTCFCFGFSWEADQEGSTKLRTWDSCMFLNFARHASGHNPREEKYRRFRQRIMHKFSYHPLNYGEKAACSGCGRCITACPVNLDIRMALAAAQDYLKGADNGE